jgi:hypothetical protein
MAPMPDGGIVLVDTRAGGVARLDRTGKQVASWSLPEIQCVSANALGQVFAAAGEALWRLDLERAPLRLASQGDFAPVAALAADVAGGLWLLDRRGDRIGRVDPGGATPGIAWQDRGPRLTALTWDGARLIVADGRDGSLLKLDAGRALAPFAALERLKPAALASDLAGRVAVLDARASQVVLLGADGSPRGEFAYRDAGIQRPVDVALGRDGSLQLFDEAAGAWVRLP